MRAFFAEGQFETDEGERLTLVCDFYAIDVVEQIVGQDWDDVVGQINASRAISAKVLYGLLRRHHSEITLDEALALSYDKNSIVLWAIVGELIRRATNLPEEPEQPKTTKKKPSGRSRTSAKNG